MDLETRKRLSKRLGARPDFWKPNPDLLSFQLASFLNREDRRNGNAVRQPFIASDFLCNQKFALLPIGNDMFGPTLIPRLLSGKQIQQELVVNAQQADEIKNLWGGMVTVRLYGYEELLQEIGREQAEQAVGNRQRKLRDQIVETLLPNQKVRLEELLLQLEISKRGYPKFVFDMIETLGEKTDGKDDVKLEFVGTIREMEEKYRTRMNELSSEVDDTFLNILDSKQRTQLEQWMGSDRRLFKPWISLVRLQLENGDKPLHAFAHSMDGFREPD